MSNEITVRSQLVLANGNLNVLSTPSLLTLQVDQAAQGSSSPTLSIPTSDTAVTIGGNVTTLGWCWFRNLDPTNYVDWGADSAGAIVPVGRMQPGECAGPFRLKPGITLRMQAHTGACIVQMNFLAN